MSDFTSPGLAPPPAVEPDRLVWSYAGFWWRVLAFLIDWVVLLAIQTGLALALGLRSPGLSLQEQPEGAVSNVDWTVSRTQSLALSPHWPHPHWHGTLLSVLGLLIGILYYVLLESSRWQATLGKRICRIRVTDLAGRRIGMLRALGRYLGKFVSALILGIGFLMAGWTRRKQALHDMMAGTLVMRLRPAETVFAFQPPRAVG